MMFNKIYVRYLMATNMPKMFELIQTRIWCKQMFNQWIENLDPQKNNNVLDVGCGPGILTQSLSEIGCIAVGLDQSDAMLTLARSHKVNSSENLDFKLGDALNLPFEKENFDFVIAASLINIIPDPNRALQEMHRCTKPGGKLSFLVPSPTMNSNNVKVYCKSNNIRGLAATLLELWASNAISLSKDDALQLAQLAGLKNIIAHTYLDEMVISITGTKS